jgi:cell division protein FtsL
MRIKKQNLGELYAARAMEEREPQPSTISIPRIRESRDLVYNGKPFGDYTANEGAVQAPRNKKHRKRKISPFAVVMLLLGAAVFSVFYIGNILAVGHLIMQINQLQVKHQQTLNEQELLKAQINRLSGLERIQQLAHDQLGLQNNRQLPLWIELNSERLHEVEELYQQQGERKR